LAFIEEREETRDVGFGDGAAVRAVEDPNEHARGVAEIDVEAGEHLPGDYGVTGCWLSHLTAYFEISDRVRKRGLPDLPVMILEDDIYLEPNATQLITLGGESLPDDWEVFFVGFKNDYCFYKAVLVDAAHHRAPSSLI
jgi:GR25 family glycosyltransferase involved in LPS biosynthesis